MRAALLSAALLGCSVSGGVTRIADGSREDGRYIDSSAYTAYARGALLEASGDSAGALSAYEAALDADPGSADVLTRIGALHCRVDPRHPARADAAFDAALEKDSGFAPAYAARARCLERRGQLEAALEQARLAVTFDPETIELSELVARLLFTLRRKAEAWVWLDALVSLHPSSPQAWQVFRSFAELAADTVRLRRARLAERSLGVLPLAQTEAAGDTIDVLLRARDLDGARRAAVMRRWKSSTLALRAAEVGAHAVAVEQARHVLQADPSDSDAWVALLVSADQLHDVPLFAQALEALDTEPTTPSARAAELLAALLARRVGEEAARAFRDAYVRGGENAARDSEP
jgi:tetratricopeptide (TPR) repeat protein